MLKKVKINKKKLKGGNLNILSKSERKTKKKEIKKIIKNITKRIKNINKNQTKISSLKLNNNLGIIFKKKLLKLYDNQKSSLSSKIKSLNNNKHHLKRLSRSEIKKRLDKIKNKLNRSKNLNNLERTLNSIVNKLRLTNYKNKEYNNLKKYYTAIYDNNNNLNKYYKKNYYNTRRKRIYGINRYPYSYV